MSQQYEAAPEHTRLPEENWDAFLSRATIRAMQVHEYIHVGGGALYCKPCEVLVTERDGAAAVHDMKDHEANPPYRSQP